MCCAPKLCDQHIVHATRIQQLRPHTSTVSLGPSNIITICTHLGLLCATSRDSFFWDRYKRPQTCDQYHFCPKSCCMSGILANLAKPIIVPPDKRIIQPISLTCAQLDALFSVISTLPWATIDAAVHGTWLHYHTAYLTHVHAAGRTVLCHRHTAVGHHRCCCARHLASLPLPHPTARASAFQTVWCSRQVQNVGLEGFWMYFTN